MIVWSVLFLNTSLAFSIPCFHLSSKKFTFTLLSSIWLCCYFPSLDTFFQHTLQWWEDLLETYIKIISDLLSGFGNMLVSFHMQFKLHHFWKDCKLLHIIFQHRNGLTLLLYLQSIKTAFLVIQERLPAGLPTIYCTQLGYSHYAHNSQKMKANLKDV